jgi:hypothetical protein
MASIAALYDYAEAEATLPPRGEVLFYKRSRTSASGLDPEGEVRTLIKQSTVSTDTVAT